MKQSSTIFLEVMKIINFSHIRCSIVMILPSIFENNAILEIQRPIFQAFFFIYSLNLPIQKTFWKFNDNKNTERSAELWQITWQALTFCLLLFSFIFLFMQENFEYSLFALGVFKRLPFSSTVTLIWCPSSIINMIKKCFLHFSSVCFCYSWCAYSFTHAYLDAINLLISFVLYSWAFNHFGNRALALFRNCFWKQFSNLENVFEKLLTENRFLKFILKISWFFNKFQVFSVFFSKIFWATLENMENTLKNICIVHKYAVSSQRTSKAKQIFIFEFPNRILFPKTT